MEEELVTSFAAVYNCFLGKITDDLYVEMTPLDTIRDLQQMLLWAIPHFEFPRKDLYNYSLSTKTILPSELTEHDFIVGEVQVPVETEPEQESVETESEQESQMQTMLIIDNSCFNTILTSEEINILAILMMVNWVQRQTTSIENTRMKYSGSDFKMTSQANHLAKLQSLLNDTQREAKHMQRLYKRRRLEVDQVSNTVIYRSNWDVFGYGVYY